MNLRLSFVAVVSFIFFNGLSSVHSHGGKGPSKDGKTCTNPSCEAIAADLKSCMDTTVNPCEDFYKFTCGKFLKTTPDGGGGISKFGEGNNRLKEKIRAIFEKDNCNDCPPYETYFKDYYRACMNTSEIEKDGEEMILDMFNELGGWPLIDDSWDESKADLTNIMTTMLDYSLMSMFELFVINDETNSSIYTISMRQGTVTLSTDFYTDEKHSDKIDAFNTLINKQVNALSKGKAETSETEKNVKEIIAFETSLSMILYAPEQSRLLHQKKIALSRLADFFKGVVNMTAIVEKLFGDVGIQIDGEELIAIYGIDYFDKLAKLLKETSKRTVVNYLFWKMFIGLNIATPHKYETYEMEFDVVVSGTADVDPRQTRCSSLVTTQLFKPFGAVYAKAYFDADAKSKVKNLIDYLKKSFETMIRSSTWLTPETQSLAINKLYKMPELIGYPDYYDTDKNLFEEMFDKIKNDDIESKSFLRKHLDFLAIVVDENYKLLGTTVDLDKPDMEVAIINAYYNTLTNSIIFPAGILQEPFFSDEIPMYLNYGAIGSFIGHEITHGFDDTGRKYDEKGTLRNWWKDEDQENYVEASDCIADMYSNFVVEEINETINGNLTLGENIADNGGLRAAFMAYKNWKEENGEESKLPDLDFTPEQLFFINYGRLYCQNIIPQSKATLIREDDHSLHQFRVIGPIMNMKEFSEVFKCQPDSPMNPEKKCRVW